MSNRRSCTKSTLKLRGFWNVHNRPRRPSGRCDTSCDDKHLFLNTPTRIILPEITNQAVLIAQGDLLHALLIPEFERVEDRPWERRSDLRGNTIPTMLAPRIIATGDEAGDNAKVAQAWCACIR